VFIHTSDYPDQDYLNIDLTEFVNDWYLDPSSNHGVILELIDQYIYRSMKFCSSDSEIPKLRPKLEIKYSRLNSVSEDTKDLKLKLFPNPASDYLVIDLGSDFAEEISIEIIDSRGKLVQYKENLSPNTQIDIADYSKGIYFVKVSSREFVSTKRFVVE